MKKILNFDCGKNLKEWLRNIKKTQNEEGAIPGIVPTGGWGFEWGNGPVWDAAIVTLPYYIYRYDGDISAFSENAESIANFGSATLGGYFSKIGTAFKENAKFAFLVAFITVSCVIGVPLYIGMDSFYGVALGMILLSFSVLMLLAFQWYLPIKILLKNDFKKCLKKCFIILFDNFGFSVFMAFYSLILLACSVILFFFLPGFNGILLGYVNALRLRLYKYDWLECHPAQKAEKERQNIPWDELIKEDETTLGKKSIKSLLMPWKAEHED